MVRSAGPIAYCASEPAAGRADGVARSRHSYEITPCEEEGGHHLVSVNFIRCCVSNR